MRTHIRAITIILLSCIVAAELDAESLESENRLKDMKLRIQELVVSEEGMKFGTEPLLRYTDPGRKLQDAAVFRLGKEGRPKSILVLEKYVEGKYPSYELAVTSDDPPRTIQGTNFRWALKSKAMTWRKLESTKPPSKRKQVRGSQLKQIARKFDMREEWLGQTAQLRMLARPLDSYIDDNEGVVDGRIFVFAHGTNPEVLLLIEAYKSKKEELSWRVSFAPLCGAKVTIEYDRMPLLVDPFRGRRGISFWSDGGPLKAQKKAAANES